MEFHLVKNTTDSFFQSLWLLYEAAFPSDERRNLLQLKKILRKKEYTLFAVLEEKEFVGLFSTWDLGTFIFIDHFAVKEELRGKGFGTKILTTSFERQKQDGKEISKNEFEEIRRKLYTIVYGVT
ncbi:GNAT family N-acetyltransferase [Candidatus Woesearchaeota archaeon]|nr:GNAT family N-acetyltransferase [Candidatus Woesearchaeota archaeon]